MVKLQRVVFFQNVFLRLGKMCSVVLLWEKVVSKVVELFISLRLLEIPWKGFQSLGKVSWNPRMLLTLKGLKSAKLWKARNIHRGLFEKSCFFGKEIGVIAFLAVKKNFVHIWLKGKMRFHTGVCQIFIVFNSCLLYVIGKSSLLLETFKNGFFWDIWQMRFWPSLNKAYFLNIRLWKWAIASWKSFWFISVLKETLWAGYGLFCRDLLRKSWKLGSKISYLKRHRISEWDR